jgi:hypothetical protein
MAAMSFCDVAMLNITPAHVSMFGNTLQGDWHDFLAIVLLLKARNFFV